MHLSIIIPLYNEESLVLEVLKRLESVELPRQIERFEVVIVDDASTDGSFKAVSGFAAGKDHIKVFRHEKNKGKGAAVKTGVFYSKGDHVLIQDADLELDPNDIPRLVDAMLLLKVPFINGSRYMPGVLRTQAGFKRYFANKLFTLVTSILIDVHLTDMACGYKLISRELFDRLDLREDRFGFEAELIIKCGRLRRNWIAEVPVHYSPRNLGEGKKLRSTDGLRIIGTIIKYGLFRLN